MSEPPNDPRIDQLMAQAFEGMTHLKAGAADLVETLGRDKAVLKLKELFERRDLDMDDLQLMLAWALVSAVAE